MDNEFVPAGKLQLSIQNGMDGQRRNWLLPRWLCFAFSVLAFFMLISTILFFLQLAGYLNAQTRLQKLEDENATLRSKLDFYASTVDSIFSSLDSLKHVDSTGPDYPSLDFSRNAKQTDLAYDPALKRQINTLETKLAYILAQVSPVETFYTPTLDELAAGELPPDYMPSIYPTFGRISDGWGMRVHPITNELEFHYGIDIANQPGTAIYATASGTVITTDYDTGYGKRIIIEHGSGYQTLYAHLYSYQVRVGDNVAKGQIIGLMGNSGISTGPHLHYEVRNASGKINPTAYLNRIDEPSYAMR
ncbi:MAG TPA: M23 family metallopeptidase [Candidatus Cloacimonas sp.]|nr:M23 family metallopeptidase [Candidatus Cloacimonas sp.]